MNENELAQAARKEEKTRPVIGGGGADDQRQRKLDEELGLSADVIEARKLFDAGEISAEEFETRTGMRP